MSTRAALCPASWTSRRSFWTAGEPPTWPFAGTGDGPTAVGLLATSPRVVVLRTFSKAFGLAGLRVGYGWAAEALRAAPSSGHRGFRAIEAVADGRRPLGGGVQHSIELTLADDHVHLAAQLFN